MTLEVINSAVKLAQSSGIKFMCFGRVETSIVNAYEQTLGVDFPKSFRFFLENFGRISFGSRDIYGVVKDGFNQSSVPNFYWFTKVLRERSDISNSMVVIGTSGFGPHIILETGKMDSDNECPVCLVRKTEIIEDLAPSFGIFLSDEIKAEIEDERL